MIPEGKRISKHDRYVIDLCRKIKNRYDFVVTHVPIRNKKCSLGEIDVLARKGDKIDLYEVKCSYRIVKAKKQLARIHKHFPMNYNNYYFYCGSANALVLVQ